MAKTPFTFSCAYSSTQYRVYATVAYDPATDAEARELGFKQYSNYTSKITGIKSVKWDLVEQDTFDKPNFNQPIVASVVTKTTPAAGGKETKLYVRWDGTEKEVQPEQMPDEFETAMCAQTLYRCVFGVVPP